MVRASAMAVENYSRAQVTAMVADMLRKDDSLTDRERIALQARLRYPRDPLARVPATGMTLAEVEAALSTAIARWTAPPPPPPREETAAEREARIRPLTGANVQRAASAAERDARAARDALRVPDLPAKHRDVLAVRAADPEASLSDLARRCGRTKDAYNAALRRALAYVARHQACEQQQAAS